MSNPSGPVRSSVSESGKIPEVPGNPFSLAMKGENGEVTGLLEKWSKNAWIYARSDSLVDLN